MKPSYPIFILIIGLFILYAGYRSYTESKSTESWPTTNAVATQSEIKERSENVYDEDGDIILGKKKNIIMLILIFNIQ